MRMYAGECGKVVIDMGLSTSRSIFAIGMDGCLVMRRVRAASLAIAIACEHTSAQGRRSEVCESRVGATLPLAGITPHHAYPILRTATLLLDSTIRKEYLTLVLLRPAPFAP